MNERMKLESLTTTDGILTVLCWIAMVIACFSLQLDWRPGEFFAPLIMVIGCVLYKVKSIK
jgi:hypothetical protein